MKNLTNKLYTFIGYYFNESAVEWNPVCVATSRHDDHCSNRWKPRGLSPSEAHSINDCR